jgi:hypothetical protein
MTDGISSGPSFLSLALKKGTQIKALKVSLLVGTTLTLINQWENVMGHHAVDMFCLTCTYLVPYLVVTYTVSHEARDRFTKQSASSSNP